MIINQITANMRRILLGLALTLAALPAWAQSRDENLAKCQSNNPNNAISGCTALIEAGHETRADLSEIYNNRGVAYFQKRLYTKAKADLDRATSLAPPNSTTGPDRR
jgi:tetratricopeptide (TPR) repeat protein